MEHWTSKYMQITFSQMNCAQFVEHILRNEFKIDYKFPQSEGSFFNQSAQIRNNFKNYCTKTEEPKDGDLVLMHGKRLMCHVGLYVKIKNEEYVFHTEKSMKTASLHPLKSLLLFGYSVEGFYSWVK